MNNIAPSEPSYIERAAQMTAEQRAALRDVLTDKYQELQRLVATEKFTALRGVNVAREIGAQIELFTGHQKLLPAEFNSLSPALPDASLEFAKACLALHHKYEAPLTSADYARAAPEWEHLLVQLELLPVPQRQAARNQPLDEPVKDFISGVIKVAQSSVALEKEAPIEKWPQFYLATFIRESQHIHDLHERARTLVKS